MSDHLNRGLHHVLDTADEQTFWQPCAPCACHVPLVRLVSSLGAVLWALFAVPRVMLVKVDGRLNESLPARLAGVSNLRCVPFTRTVQYLYIDC